MDSYASTGKYMKITLGNDKFNQEIEKKILRYHKFWIYTNVHMNWSQLT